MLKHIRNALLASPRQIKQGLAIFSDAVICAIAVQLAMDLRLEMHVAWTPQHTWLFLLGIATFLPIFIALGFIVPFLDLQVCRLSLALTRPWQFMPSYMLCISLYSA
jgi:hypothetical protein